MQRWRRFERASRSGEGRYWEVRVVDSTVELRHGPVGGDEVSRESLAHADASQAKKAARQKVRAKQRAGWVEVERPDEDRARLLEHRELLERAIAEDPSPANWAVYADYLQEVEPALGERVALGLALAGELDRRERSRAEARVRELEHDHARELLGVTLAGLLQERKFAGMVELDWATGVIAGARLTDIQHETVKFEGLVAALLELTAARLLGSLEIATALRCFVAIVEQLVAREHPALRRLSLRVTDRPRDGLPVLRGEQAKLGLPPGDLRLAALLDRMPRLEQLDIVGPLAGEAEHPHLRELELRRPSEFPTLPLASWRLPALERLVLNQTKFHEWSQVAFPRLHTLEFIPRGDVRLQITGLADAPLLDSLDTLILRDFGLRDSGFAVLLERAERFARLRRFCLLDVTVDYWRTGELEAALPNLELRRYIDWGR